MANKTLLGACVLVVGVLVGGAITAGVLDPGPAPEPAAPGAVDPGPGAGDARSLGPDDAARSLGPESDVVAPSAVSVTRRQTFVDGDGAVTVAVGLRNPPDANRTVTVTVQLVDASGSVVAERRRPSVFLHAGTGVRLPWRFGAADDVHARVIVEPAA